jgi:signal transduction histidine kinase
VVRASRWLEDRVAFSELPPGWQRGVTLTALMIIGGIATFDVLVDVQFSHSAVYVTPVVIAAMFTSSSQGLLVAGASATAWVVADALTSDSLQAGDLAFNQVLRLASFAAVVVMFAVLRHALLRATRAEQRSRRFLADAAHQLRTPIAGLQASAETLLMGPHTTDQETMLLNIARQGSRAGRLVGGLLQLSRLDQGEAGVVRPVDVSALCADEVESARRLCSPSVAITLDAKAAPTAPVVIDPEATREALSNLLDNARRHARTQIDVRLGGVPGQLTIAVADDGPGLDPSIADTAFERFASYDGQGGSGLGLAIARGFVERQGGELTYRDGVFVIRLPY